MVHQNQTSFGCYGSSHVHVSRARVQFYIHASAGALLVTWLMSMFHGCEKNFLPIFCVASSFKNFQFQIPNFALAVSCIDFDFKI